MNMKTKSNSYLIPSGNKKNKSKSIKVYFKSSWVMIKSNILSITQSGTRILKNGKFLTLLINKKIWDFLNSVPVLLLVTTVKKANSVKVSKIRKKLLSKTPWEHNKNLFQLQDSKLIMFSEVQDRAIKQIVWTPTSN